MAEPTDLPAVQEPDETAIAPIGPTIPAGRSPIHGHVNSSEIWRLCCRLRLDMREDGLGVRDAHLALRMAFPDLDISQKDFKKFLETFVDDTIILEPSFFRSGLMRAAKVKLNAVAEASKVAEKMQKAFEKATAPTEPLDLQRYMLSGARAMAAREKQFDLMGRIGMGPQTDQQRAAPTKMQVSPVHIEHATFQLSEAVGGTFARRAMNPVMDADAKVKPSQQDDATATA